MSRHHMISIVNTSESSLYVMLNWEARQSNTSKLVDLQTDRQLDLKTLIKLTCPPFLELSCV